MSWSENVGEKQPIPSPITMNLYGLGPKMLGTCPKSTKCFTRHFAYFSLAVKSLNPLVKPGPPIDAARSAGPPDSEAI